MPTSPSASPAPMRPHAMRRLSKLHLAGGAAAGGFLQLSLLTSLRAAPPSRRTRSSSSMASCSPPTSPPTSSARTSGQGTCTLHREPLISQPVVQIFFPFPSLTLPRVGILHELRAGQGNRDWQAAARTGPGQPWKKRCGSTAGTPTGRITCSRRRSERGTRFWTRRSGQRSERVDLERFWTSSWL